MHHNTAHLVKSNLRSAVYLGPIGYQFAALLNSASFLYLLLRDDRCLGSSSRPLLRRAAYHVVPAGGKFDTHADTNTDPNTGLFRRLAMLTYLNHGHYSIYAPSVYQRKESLGRRLAKELLPPIAVRALKSIKRNAGSTTS